MEVVQEDQLQLGGIRQTAVLEEVQEVIQLLGVLQLKEVEELLITGTLEAQEIIKMGMEEVVEVQEEPEEMLDTLQVQGDQQELPVLIL
jgi:hypothetical protein